MVRGPAPRGKRGPYNRPMSSAEHRAKAPASVRCAVLTVSDTRTEATDTAGRAITALLADAGHTMADRAIVRDEPAVIETTLRGWLGRDDVDAVIPGGRREAPGEGAHRLPGRVEDETEPHAGNSRPGRGAAPRRAQTKSSRLPFPPGSRLGTTSRAPRPAAARQPMTFSTAARRSPSSRTTPPLPRSRRPTSKYSRPRRTRRCASPSRSPQTRASPTPPSTHW